MSNANYDVIVVGCGPAGVSAAIGLARADFSVLVLEGAPFPGAENWSGAIYFTENLAHPDLLGPKGVEELPFERRIVRRGMLMSNGHSSFGLSYRNAETFANNYSVLRPTYDHYLARVAEGFGATVLSETTVTSLIRHRGRIIGVNTDRGPFYSNLVFLAEGDASHLVSQEGYERVKEAGAPHFLQGIREVIPMSPADIERIYGVGAGEGAAFEIILRNGAVNNRLAQLNMGGFIYTNADSLSVGLVLPLDNLAHHFSGDHNRLMEWFKSLPEIQRLTGGEPSVSYGTKIIRGGGLKEIPALVDHGLAIGGAASGIGTDFPYPNFTGPATFMGLQIARAAREIRRGGGEFTREALEKSYVAPLKTSHYYKNVEYLRDWPDYVERTTFFFGRQVDAALGSLYALSRPEFDSFQKFWHAAKMLREAVPPKRLPETFSDLLLLNRTLKLGDIFRHAFQSLAFRNSESSSSSSSDSFDFHYSVEGKLASFSDFPFPFRRFFASRYTQRAFARAADTLYCNDDIPLDSKLRRGLELCLRGLCPLDVALVGAAKVTLLALLPLQWVCEMINLLITRPSPQEFLASFYQHYLARTRALTNLNEAQVTQSFEQKLAMSTYFSEKTSHIHVLRPNQFENRGELIKSALWHVCPAKVYEVHPDDVGQSQVTVNFENCVKCESCWRGSPDVDWSRARQQRLIYRVVSPASEKLFARLCQNGVAPHPPKSVAPWLPANLEQVPLSPIASEHAAEFHADLQKLRWQIESFRSTLARAPRALSHDDQRWLMQLAFNAASVGQDADRSVRKALCANEAGGAEFAELWTELRQQLARMQVNVHRKKFFWADADAGQILDHHLPALLRFMPPTPPELPFQPLLEKLWRLEPQSPSLSNQFRLSIRTRLDAAFDKQAIKGLEKGQPLAEAQIACLRELAQSFSDHRQILLEELARKDPSLAFLVSHHWLASELLGEKSPSSISVGEGWRKWRALAFHGNTNKKLFVLTALAQEFVVIEGDKVFCVPRSAVKVEPVQTLGLAATKVSHLTIPTAQASKHLDTQALNQRLTADLISIALGMGRYLLERALAHAKSRVQFPRAFRDEDGNDTIAKFGAVKQFLSEMEADVFLLETLSHYSSSLSSSSSAAIALLVGELIGTQPGSLAYNCGQVFGGTAYSEDDVISKFYRDSGVFAFILGRDIEHRLAVADAFTQGEFPVAPTADELALFEDAARRGALRYPLESLLAETKKLADIKQNATAPSLRSSIGQSAARWWGVKLLLLRAAARLERGEDARKQVECCRLLADRAESAISDGDYNSEQLGREILVGGYFEQPLAAPIPFSYSELCHREQTYDFGDYLLKPFGSLAARYLPEHLHLDKELAAYNAKVRGDFEALLRRVVDGLPYSRQIEKLHAVPDIDIQMLLREGFMRMFIPKELGGEGRPKAHYYILVTHSMRYGEPGIALTIQAHQSIGVTPMLLGLNQDIPRAKKELEDFLADDSLVKKLDREIAQMLADIHMPAVLKIKEKFTRLGDFVRAEIGKRASLRAIAADFIEAFMAAGRVGLRMDLKGFEENLKNAHAILPKLCERAEADLAELIRREEAHRQFLRYIANGAISCFALTEPSAGSDTASVGTRAVLRKAEVFTDKDGSKYFWLDENNTQRRKLISADQWDLCSPPPETDVATIRREGDKEFYEFYELNGAKMWITNAHIAGAMAMYAKTEVGPTGFMLRAPVEGLTVGNDELKMGQRGSPTNELGLSGVRVPRENIIGIEGRGQVNALETLNAGRMGLSVSSMAMIQKIIEQTRAFVREHKLDDVPWVHELLGQMTEELYAVESLAFELIGIFDHKGTRNARVESAIGKYYGAEALHRVIRASMTIHGILGQTAQYEIEKHLRDARILNIYEGTNEVQRFLILRDLVETLLPKWKSSSSSNLDAEKFTTDISSLESAKTRLFCVLDDATKLFGPQIWNNPNFQPTFFPLAEIAGLIKVCDSVLARTIWLESNISDATDARDRRHLQLAELSARNVLAKAFAEIEQLFHRVEHQLDPCEHYHQILRRGFYPSEIRIATLALRESGSHSHTPKLKHSITPKLQLSKPVHIAVVLQPQPILSPRPQLADEQIIEPYWTLPPADRHALALALRLKEHAEPRENVRVTVVARGPAIVQDSLRRALSVGADDAIWDCDETLFTTPGIAGARIGGVFASESCSRFLILVGEDQVLGSIIASDYQSDHVVGVRDVALGRSGDSLQLLLAALPLCPVEKRLFTVVNVVPPDDVFDLRFSSREFLESFVKTFIKSDGDFSTPPLEFAVPEVHTAIIEKDAIDSPEAAGKLFMKNVKLGNGAAEKILLYKGEFASTTVKGIVWNDCAYFVAINEINVEVLDVAASLADMCGLPLCVFVFCDADEVAQRRIVAQALAYRAKNVGVLTKMRGQTWGRQQVGAALRSLFTAEMLAEAKRNPAEAGLLLMGDVQMNDVFAAMPQGFNGAVFGAKEIVEVDDGLVFATPMFAGKLNALQLLDLPLRAPTWVTFEAGATISSLQAKMSAFPKDQWVFRVALDLDAAAETDEIEQLLVEARKVVKMKSLKDAEFLIDVGYAIRTREQLEQVVTPLQKALEEIGVRGVMVGGTRKVVEELKLLRHDQQIGQTGSPVNPRVIIALGVSGAPQHVDYIGDRAVIFAFNKDAEAPLMTLNQRRKAPKVYPIVGDLYENVPRFIAALRGEK